MNISRAAAVMLVALLAASVPAFSLVAWAGPEDERLDRLEGELGILKKENAELKHRVETMETDDEQMRHDLGTVSKLVDVSGYAAAEFYHTDQDSENDRFRVRYLSLFFTKEVQRDWKLFTEIEYEDGPKVESNAATNTVKSSQGTIFVEQLYIEYHPSLDWDVRFGRVNTPAGIWSIYHYPPYVPFQTDPLFYKNVFPEVSDGIQLRNSFSSRESVVDTHLYVANGAGNPGSGDRNENKGVGARVNAELSGGVSAGASYYRERDNQDTTRRSFGLHLNASYNPWRFQTEYATRHNGPEGGVRSFNDSGWYAQLGYDIAKWTIAARYDWYDSNDTDAANDRFRTTGAINYHFASNVVGKLEYSRNEFDEPASKDYNEFIASIVVAIGDL
ncbi:MAG: porin [Deltaproteobacteria bacterium]